MAEQTITGRIVGDKYRITGFQRAGRMGELYVARRVDTNERVTIKMLDPGLFGEKEAVKRFERETRITAKLDSPCTLVVNDFGRTEDGLPWMALEYVQGELLSDAIESQPLAPERAAYVTAQIAMALSEAHRIGVVHRDIAPENVLLTTVEGQVDSVKVLDFGLSRLQGSEGTEHTALTAVGVRIGNPAYMAPEYIDEHDLDSRADLYSLGILLYEMLTGEQPFTGRPYKVLDKHLNAPMPMPSAKVPGVPGWIDQLVARLTVKEPADRIQDADTVIRAIEQGLGHRVATVQTVVEPEPAPVPEPAPRPKTPPRPAPPSSRAPAASRPEHDPALIRFIQAQILDRTDGIGALDPAECMVVEGVAPLSVASALGVQPGWLVHLPDEAGGGMLDPDFALTPADSRRVQLSSADGKTRFEVRLTGADPGMDLTRSGAHVRRYYTPTRDRPEALLDVWREGDWDTLEKLSWRTLTQQRGAAGVLNTGLFARFLGKDEIRQREHPALLTYGAALYETGRIEEGIALILEYKAKYADQWPVAFDALAHYYGGMHKERTRDPELAAELHVQSWLRWPNRRAARRIQALTGHHPDTRAWYGRQFPDYRLDVVDSRSQVALYETLSHLGEDQLLLVCMMGGFRGNVAYNAFMRAFLAYSADFGRFLPGVHVVTHRIRRDEDRPEHYQAEDLVVASGLHFRLLEDYRAFVQRTIKPAHVPTIYAIDREGWVVHEGKLDSVGLWEMLETASRVRMDRR